MLRASMNQNGMVSHRWHKYSGGILLLVWCLGIYWGAYTAIITSDTLCPLMRSSVSQTVTISGLLVVVAVPFLFCVYAVYLHEPFLILIICAVKAFGYGFCTCGVYMVFGQSGWLVRLLYLFSDSCFIPILYSYWLRNISGLYCSGWRENCVYFTCLLLIGGVDYYLVSPYLARLILW